MSIFALFLNPRTVSQSLNLKKMLNHHFLESCTTQTPVRPSEDMPSELVGAQILYLRNKYFALEDEEI